MTAKIEVTFRAGYFSKSCGRWIDGGYIAECTNPENFNCTQIYSQTASSKNEACDDIRMQLAQRGATEFHFYSY